MRLLEVKLDWIGLFIDPFEITALNQGVEETAPPRS
jgi:hypothetical protein